MNSEHQYSMTLDNILFEKYNVQLYGSSYETYDIITPFSMKVGTLSFN
jgi:hypothetical protein